MRKAPFLIAPLLALAACDPDVITTSYQGYSIALIGPAVDANQNGDPFSVTEKYRVTLKFWEDSSATIPYGESLGQLPEEFQDFKAEQVYEFLGTKTKFAFGEGKPLSVPRLTADQTKIFLTADVVGLDGTDKPVARARCPVMALEAGAGPKGDVECKPFYGLIGKWNKIKAPAKARHSFAAAALPDGRVVIAGGQPSSMESTNPMQSVEIYEPAKENTADGTFGQWREVGALSVARYDLTAVTTTSGQVVFAGGRSGSTFLNQVDIFDGNQVRAGTSTLSDPRTEHAAALLGGDTVILAAGRKSNTAPNVSFERLTPTAPPTVITAGTNERFGPCLAQVRTNLLLLCGGGQKNCMTFDGNAPGAPMETAFARKDVKCASVNGSVFLVGGVNDVNAKSIEMWREGDSSPSVWDAAPRSLVAHAVAVANGKVVVTGGYLAGTTEPLKSSFWFDPKLAPVHDLSGPGNDMEYARAFHQMVGLPDGTVMAIGGKMRQGDTVQPGAEIFVVPE